MLYSLSSFFTFVINKTKCKTIMKQFLLALCLLTSTLFAYSQQETISLPEPTKLDGMPLMEALSKRHSHRDFSGQELDNQTLSNLLWAAHGFNRPDKRTSATSQNRQEMDVYVVFREAVYLYDAKENKLSLKVKGDVRTSLGQPNITEQAAATLVYVANMDKASNREAGFVDAGSISQNVYLYCASAGLGCVVRASFKRPDLHNALKLTSNQEITIVQPVGYMK